MGPAKLNENTKIVRRLPLLTDDIFLGTAGTGIGAVTQLANVLALFSGLTPVETFTDIAAMLAGDTPLKYFSYVANAEDDPDVGEPTFALYLYIGPYTTDLGSYILISSGVDTGGGGGLDIEFVIRETPSGAVNSSNTVFVLAAEPIAGTDEVYRNGMLQTEGSDYSIVTDTITFSVAPNTGDIVRVSYQIPGTTVSEFEIRETPAGSVNGSNTNFVLANVPILGTEEVFWNGMLCADGGVDYTITSDTIVFNLAPDTGDIIRVSYQH